VCCPRRFICHSPCLSPCRSPCRRVICCSPCHYHC
jgi:hypothetical protein